MKFCGYSPKVKQTKWKSYEGSVNSSYIDWYFCDEHSKDFAIRDVTKKGKLEPHYEDGSFNACRKCNRLLLSGALGRHEKYVFFFTKYVGKIKEFQNKYFITGYYEISKTCDVQDKHGIRKTILSQEPKFVRIQDAMSLDKIFKSNYDNPRHIQKRIDAKKTDIILEYFKNKKMQLRIT